eukprot:GFUD01033067.1.p2 GENE.GFUD01033067.1~~GFUD01033067.1.p2  ORF type:complete len:138 (+),score=39.18 GFUD01033067.1:279-692(+)
MADTVSIYPDSANSSVTSSLSVIPSGSHCWEPDGSFHSVCIFVIGMSIVCGIVTVISVYRIGQMVIASVRDPENIHETLKMYKLQTVQGSDTTMSRKCTAENMNSIETVVEVETVPCRLNKEEEEEGTGKGRIITQY